MTNPTTLAEVLSDAALEDGFFEATLRRVIEKRCPSLSSPPQSADLPRLCINCKWEFKGHCHHAKNNEYDRVTGSRDEAPSRCQLQREASWWWSFGYCGKIGRWWEPKS